jgi:predicted alpha/beta-hydrolase family hydrolase
MTTTQLTLSTPRGEALVALDRGRRRARGLLVLGHGAAGDVDAADLVAVRDAVVRADFAVARVTQPYRVGGRRPPPAAPVLDEAWVAVVTAVRSRFAASTPLIVGGRSSGARVACRTARQLGAAGVLALAFPLHPPGRPEVTRSNELDPGVTTLVINGDRDPFGVPAPEGLIRVVVLPGERHDLKKDPAAVANGALDWLTDLVSTSLRAEQRSTS